MYDGLVCRENGDLVWRKSSKSANGNCVEAARLQGGLVGVRDSKDPHGPRLELTRGEWAAFLAGIKAGAR